MKDEPGSARGLMPAVFVGHGSPMNALSTNPYTEGWRLIGASMPRPKGIVCVSAHWYIDGTKVMAIARPKTIHDFGGFPRELYEVQYPAPGDPVLAERVSEILRPTQAILDDSWGIDHGTWSVLVHMFPKADVPVVQLSIDATKPAAFHYDLGKRLAPLRSEGILVLASGNIVHNLQAYSWDDQGIDAYDWAVEFEKKARKLISFHEHSKLVDYESLGESARLSAPTPDHYLPLLYILSLRRPDDSVSFPVEGFDGGSLSMLAVRFGRT
jgi:4,5-DOPA dioxygenase extradiol